MNQPSLFDVPAGERIKNPICSRLTHCGHTATLGPRILWDGGYNEALTCDHCGATGERSTNVLTA